MLLLFVLNVSMSFLSTTFWSRDFRNGIDSAEDIAFFRPNASSKAERLTPSVESI